MQKWANFRCKSTIIIHKADKPNAVGDLPDTNILAAKDVTEIDLAPTNTKSATLRYPYRPAAQFFELPDPEGGCKTARNDQKSTVRLALSVCRLRGKRQVT